MKKRFTKANVLEVLRQWPQAVSTDAGDLRVLHDMANAGAQMWGQRLPWPDYLWVDFDDELPSVTPVRSGIETYNVIDPTGNGPHATFSAHKQVLDESLLPPSGKFRIGQRVICMLELKVIDANLVPKLAAYRPGMPWPDFLHMKLDESFGRRLREADQQIAGGKRLLPFGDACGVTIIVSGSTNLPDNIVLGFLSRAIHGFSNIDAVLYLSDTGGKPYAPAFVVKGDDPRIKRFQTQVSMMLSSFTYGGGLPISRVGPQPELVVRIEMDQRSRAMYRSWATGWRANDDQTPVPSPSMTIGFVRAEEFVSGLPRTEPDPTLLDCRFRWDLDGTNLRLDN
jgi:hypothetical protein